MNIQLKSVIHDQPTNSVEATWVNEIAPAYDVPESIAPDTEDKDGNVIPGRIIPAHTVPAVEVQVKCHSYADVQMDWLEVDLGDDAPAHADLIALVRSKIVPYVPPVPTVVECVAKIDADTDAIYGAALGNRGEEYTRAATEAQAYKDAGYTGTVPASVQSWATAKSWTATQAADDILATATQWIKAQAAIRAARLVSKEQVRNAADAAELAGVLGAWANFVGVIRGQLGVS